MIHYLKVWPEFIPALADGSKTFELRKDDRAYAVGDSLHLHEWLTATGAYGQWTQDRVVTYKLSGPSWGIMDGFCVLGLSPVATPVQVDNASVCRFLECLRYTDDNVHVSLYGAAADGSYVDDVHVLNGVWSTEELRAAILTALGQK